MLSTYKNVTWKRSWRVLPSLIHTWSGQLCPCLQGPTVSEWVHGLATRRHGCVCKTEPNHSHKLTTVPRGSSAWKHTSTYKKLLFSQVREENNTSRKRSNKEEASVSFRPELLPLSVALWTNSRLRWAVVASQAPDVRVRLQLLCSCHVFDSSHLECGRCRTHTHTDRLTDTDGHRRWEPSLFIHVLCCCGVVAPCGCVTVDVCLWLSL